MVIVYLLSIWAADRVDAWVGRAATGEDGEDSTQARESEWMLPSPNPIDHATPFRDDVSLLPSVLPRARGPVEK